jgi:Flp pilus assembly protein TadG
MALSVAMTATTLFSDVTIPVQATDDTTGIYDFDHLKQNTGTWKFEVTVASKNKVSESAESAAERSTIKVTTPEGTTQEKGSSKKMGLISKVDKIVKYRNDTIF